jgi:hypothetical protein
MRHASLPAALGARDRRSIDRPNARRALHTARRPNPTVHSNGWNSNLPGGFRYDPRNFQREVYGIDGRLAAAHQPCTQGEVRAPRPCDAPSLAPVRVRGCVACLRAVRVHGRPADM